jgi:hypothetical protein
MNLCGVNVDGSGAASPPHSGSAALRKGDARLRGDAIPWLPKIRTHTFYGWQPRGLLIMDEKWIFIG